MKTVVGRYNRRILESGSRLMDFYVCDDMDGFPISQIPTYLTEGVNGVCLKGFATISIFSNKHHIAKNDIIVVLPYQLASITDVSEDFSMSFFRVSKTLFLDTFSGMCRLTPDFLFYMRQNFKFTLDQTQLERFSFFCDMINCRLEVADDVFRKESIINLLRVFYWDLYVYYKNHHQEVGLGKYSHKQELAFRFICLIMEHHAENREVAFYADKLCISPKYLTMLIYKMSGCSAKDWIVEYTILEIKALLRDTKLDIKQIVSLTHFHSQSLLSRFFRKHTGMTPAQYRADVMCENVAV